MYYCPIPFAGISGLFAIVLIVRYWYIVIPIVVGLPIGFILFLNWLTDDPSHRKEMRELKRKMRRYDRGEK